MKSLRSGSRNTLQMQAALLLEAKRRGMNPAAILQRRQQAKAQQVEVRQAAVKIPLIDIELRGAGKRLYDTIEPEMMLAGPAETGKTFSSLIKLHNLAATYPKSQWLVLRDTQQSVYSTVVKSFEGKILPMMGGQGISKYGGNKPEWFDYANGARVWIGGLDNVTKILSGEFDGIYVNQAEEITLNDWESLTTRVTGRAGNVPHPHIWGDCNPGASTHWIVKRRDEGKLTFLESRHEDNPRLFTPDGVITDEGKRTIATLDRLSGVRLQRLRYGKWVAAEGVIYEEFDRSLHLVEPFEIPKTWRRFRAMDLGFINPTVCQWWAMDEDGRMFCYREIYKSQTLMRDHADEINRLTAGVPRNEWRELSAESKKARLEQGEKIERTVCDHDASDRATLQAGGIYTVAAEKDVKTGIEAVQARLKKQDDGRPRLFYFNNCLVEADQALIDQGLPYSTVQEYDSYIWLKSADGKAAKEEPTKLNDHGMDTTRYAVKYADKRKHKYG